MVIHHQGTNTEGGNPRHTWSLKGERNSDDLYRLCLNTALIPELKVRQTTVVFVLSVSLSCHWSDPIPSDSCLACILTPCCQGKPLHGDTTLTLGEAFCRRREPHLDGEKREDDEGRMAAGEMREESTC